MCEHTGNGVYYIIMPYSWEEEKSESCKNQSTQTQQGYPITSAYEIGIFFFLTETFWFCYCMAFDHALITFTSSGGKSSMDLGLDGLLESERPPLLLLDLLSLMWDLLSLTVWDFLRSGLTLLSFCPEGGGGAGGYYIYYSLVEPWVQM